MDGNPASPRQCGFTLPEMLVAMVVGAIVISSVFKIWKNNQQETHRLYSVSDYRERVTLATTRLNRTITMAGFGMSRIDVFFRSTGLKTDTLKVYSNESEEHSSVIDTAKAGQTQMLLFRTTGFAVGRHIGITDSLNQEYARVTSISGDSADGYHVGVYPPLQHTYLPGVPDIYPVHQEIFYLNSQSQNLVHLRDGSQATLAGGIQDFRIKFLDRNGNEAATHRDIRSVTFTVSGTYRKVTEGATLPPMINFSSTVIPRNIL